jgi:hypothetical protein
MIMENYQFYKFLIAALEKGNKMKLEGGLDNSTHQRLDLIENLKEKYEWFALSSSDKQAKRLLKIARRRESGKDVSRQLKEVELYSKIIETIPYVKAVGYEVNNEKKHLTEDLLEFCDAQLEVIDSSLNKENVMFPSKEEVERVFKTYIERIRPNKIPVLKTYDQPEVNQKIEELYQTFIQLATD